MSTKTLTTPTTTPRRIEPLTRAVLLRARIVLVSMALVAAVLLVAVGSWPLKLAVVLAFARGLFASDIAAFRHPPRADRAKRPGRPAGSAAADTGRPFWASSPFSWR